MHVGVVSVRHISSAVWIHIILVLGDIFFHILRLISHFDGKHVVRVVGLRKLLLLVHLRVVHEWVSGFLWRGLVVLLGHVCPRLRLLR